MSAPVIYRGGLRRMFIKNKSVPEIRILPMSKSKGFYNSQIDLVQKHFFARDLMQREDGKYYYRSKGLNSLPGSLILFQYDNKVIASAQLTQIEKYSTPLEGIYSGAFCLDKDTIHVFDPIRASEINEVAPEIKSFRNGKRYIAADKLEKILSLLQQKLDFYNLPYQEKVHATNVDGYGEDIPKPKLVPTSSELKKWSKDPTEGKRAILLAGYKCEYDNNHTSFISKNTGLNYVECHHFIPMRLQDYFSNSLDVKANIISLCPVCHRKLHYGIFDEKEGMLLKLFEERKNRLLKVKLKITKQQLLNYYK